MNLNKRILLTLFTAIFLEAQAFAVALDDSTRTLQIVASKSVHRPFSWQTTKSASGWVRIFADAFGPDPAADVIGFFGMIVTVPLTIVAVPVDVVAAPLRRSRIIRLRVVGVAVDSNRTPFRKTKLTVAVKAKYPESDVLSYPLYSRSVSGETDDEGRVDIVFDASFGPNAEASVTISKDDGTGGTIQSYWLTRRWNSVRVTVNDFPNSWKLLPIESPQNMQTSGTP